MRCTPRIRRRPIQVLGAALGLAGSALAGGPLEGFDISAGGPSPVPGHVAADIVGIRWDPRCIPVPIRVNATLDPLPNPLGEPFVAVAEARATLERALDAWNRIPTSYIDMRLAGTSANPEAGGFDFVNEQTFNVRAGFPFVAASPSTSLIADSEFEDGDDLDGDGDADVSAAIERCADVDADGDIEFPAGFYPAGTILDNDVLYNARRFRFTLADEDIDAEPFSVDLEGVAVHELGHSHGLSHTLNNRKSERDASAATMFPFIDTGDPDFERSQRSLDSDDVAWSSFLYPEGSADSGPAALEAGDVAFDRVYGVIEGELAHGETGRPLAGASVSAVRRFDDTLVATGFSGTTLASYNPASGVLFAVLDPDFSLVDGRYRIPVPRGVYDVGVEAVDGSPVPSVSIGFTARIADFLGQLDFSEELYDGQKESALERDPGRSLPVPVLPGRRTRGVDLVTNAVRLWGHFGSLNFVGYTGVDSGFSYAVALPVEDLEALTDGHDFVVHSAVLHTAVRDRSVIPAFARAELTGCQVPGDGTLRVDRSQPLRVREPFLGQDADQTPWYFTNPRGLTNEILRRIARGELSALCLVLEVPQAPFPGVSAIAPFIGLDGDLVPGGPNNDVPIAELSFASLDGETWVVDPRFNYLFGLHLTVLP